MRHFRTLACLAYSAAVILWLVTAPGCASDGSFSFSKAIGCVTLGLAGGECFGEEDPAEEKAADQP